MGMLDGGRTTSVSGVEALAERGIGGVRWAQAGCLRPRLRRWAQRKVGRGVSIHRYVCKNGRMAAAAAAVLMT